MNTEDLIFVGDTNDIFGGAITFQPNNYFYDTYKDEFLKLPYGEDEFENVGEVTDRYLRDYFEL